jgi:hypothetical protein
MRVAIILGALAVLAGQARDVDAVIARMDAYLESYEPRLSSLIADETMRQEVRQATNRQQPSEISRSARSIRLQRTIQSEVAFVALPDPAGWLGFRHVMAVNGKPVAVEGDSLMTTLTRRGYDAARELLKASAQHNLGLPRTTNLPNLPLEFLHPRNRRRFLSRAGGRERLRGRETTGVVFLERVTPTLIRNPGGGDMPSVVRAWIDGDGRLIRAEVETFASAETKTAENTIRVEFAMNDTLQMLVPTEMREEFPVVKPGSGTSVASYSNFRRFQTSARIVPQ